MIVGMETMGESVKLSSLRKIAKACNLSEPDYLRLVIAWIRLEIGDKDFRRLSIQIAPNLKDASVLKEQNDAEVLRLFHLLADSDQNQIVKAMQRNKVLNCLPSINSMWDKHDDEIMSQTVEQIHATKPS